MSPKTGSRAELIVGISRLAMQMSQLYTPGHEAQQTAEYEARRAEYMQAMTDAQWRDYSDPPPVKDYRTCG